MQMLRGFDIKAIEIPTDPETGISIEALELALEQWPIKAVILVPNCNNPLGFIMPEARKRQVLALAQRHDIVIVEDDIYGELAAEYPRPRTIHSLILMAACCCAVHLPKPWRRTARRLDCAGALLRPGDAHEVRRRWV
jgi:DNA-binding transcriptional MocR family regulator